MEFENNDSSVRSRGFPLSRLIKLGCDRKRTNSNLCSIFTESDVEYIGGYKKTETSGYESFRIMIDAELKVASQDENSRLYFTHEYIVKHISEKEDLRLVMAAILYMGEKEAQIDHLQTQLTNAQIGFTDPLEQV